MNISIGGDHCGFELKTMVIKWLEERGHKVIDHGVYAVSYTHLDVYKRQV